MAPKDTITHASDLWRLQNATLDVERYAASREAAAAHLDLANMRKAMYVLLNDYYAMAELGIDKATLRFVFEYLMYYSMPDDISRLLRKVSVHREEAKK